MSRAIPNGSEVVERGGEEVPVAIEVGELGIDLTKCPRNWLPAPVDTGTGTPTVDVTARLYECRDGHWAPAGPDVKRVITFALSGTSREPGFCLNDGESANPDLYFPEQPGFELDDDATVDDRCPARILGQPNPPHDHHQTARTDAPTTEATVTIRCEDFGAWGWVEAKADDCVPIPPRDDPDAPVSCNDKGCCWGANQVSIPRDENANRIADVAAQDAAGPGRRGARQDVDDTPSNPQPGDGLTAYEEYRGFIVHDAGTDETHVRTDIDEKDLFVYDQSDLGIGHFGSSKVTVHLLKDSRLYEANHSRRINFNSRFSTQGDQHGLWLKNTSLDGGYGRIRPVRRHGSVDSPGDVYDVLIDRSKIAAKRIPGLLERVIAHELGHAVGIAHHGRWKPYHPCPIGHTVINLTELAGRPTSGNVDCVMRYGYWNGAQAWCNTHRAADGWNPLVGLPGETFCTSATATGENVAPSGFHNDATVGNCQEQIRIKDY